MTSYLLAWNHSYNEWWNDMPIILYFDNKPFEFAAYKSDFAFTTGLINTSEPINWGGEDDPSEITWKGECNSVLNRMVGKQIVSVSVSSLKIERTTAAVLNGVVMEFSDGSTDTNCHLEIFNSGDELSVSFVTEESRITNSKVDCR
jgi:hypothetical protein